MKHIPLVIGNWKLNPNRLTDAVTLASDTVKLQKVAGVTVAIAPPFVYLTEVAKKITKKQLFLAAQDVSTEPMGAFTGEVSALQLRDLGVQYVIIGHSERRAMGETDADVQKRYCSHSRAH